MCILFLISLMVLSGLGLSMPHTELLGSFLSIRRSLFSRTTTFLNFNDSRWLFCSSGDSSLN